MKTKAHFPNIFTEVWTIRWFTRELHEVLGQPKDAALKFRGCFQAVCEPRSIPIGRRGLVSPKGDMVCARQGVVVLEPTYRDSK